MLFSALFRRNITRLSDDQLVELIRKKDLKANGEFFRRYAALVMGLCLKYLKNEPQAEDMMMDIFEKLPEKISRSEIKNFKNWLYSVSRNECLMLLRKKKPESAEFDNVLLYQTDEAEDSLKLALLKDDKLNKLEAALQTLKDDQKKSLELFYLKKKSYDEVSGIMNVPVKKVKSLIQNGKRNLKLKLEGENGF